MSGITIFAVGLGEYWNQFDGLHDDLVRYHGMIADRIRGMGSAVTDLGMISTAEEAATAAAGLRGGSAPDLVVVNQATYSTSTQVLPLLQAMGAPALFLSLQPSPAMDHATVDTGMWLQYCGICSLPEMASALRKAGIPYRSVSGYLDSSAAWSRVEDWVIAAQVRDGLRTARFGLLGHLYNGMLDIATDLGAVPGQLGGHVEVLEMDDLRVRVEAVPDERVDAIIDETRDTFELDASVAEEDLRWAARVAAGLEQLVEDFSLTALAYYYRGLEGGLYERLAAGMILGASRLTARGVPCAGEYDLRTAVAMLVMDRLGAGGSFTELQACDYDAGHVEMGHDGPAHLGIAEGKPVLRGLGTYHGKRGHGVSVEFSVAHGPVTLLGVGQSATGRFQLVTAEGAVADGPRMQIGNTTSRIDFDRDPGEWVDEWSGAGAAHHWALGTGHRASVIDRLGELLGLDVRRV